MDGVTTLNASQSRSQNPGGINGGNGCGLSGGRGWHSVLVWQFQRGECIPVRIISFFRQISQAKHQPMAAMEDMVVVAREAAQIVVAILWDATPSIWPEVAADILFLFYFSVDVIFLIIPTYSGGGPGNIDYLYGAGGMMISRYSNDFDQLFN